MGNKKGDEIRRIQLTGGSTYTLSLPKNWVEEMDLDAGNGMVVDEQGSSLVLSPAKMSEEKGSKEIKIEIGSDESLDAINRKILSLYLVGYSLIEVVPEGDRIESSQRVGIKDFVRKTLVGTEVISESIEGITLQVLLSYLELSVGGALRRMYDVVTSMQENALTALEEDDRDLAKEVTEIDDEVDRFQMYLIREIRAAFQDPSLLEDIGLDSLRECLGYRLVSKNVERVGDHAAMVSQNFLEMDDSIEEESLEMLKEINSLASSILQKAVNSLFEGDYESAEEVIEELQEIYDLEEEINSYLAQQNPSEVIRIRLILESIRRIAEYGSDIAEIVLNLTINNGNSFLKDRNSD